MKRNERNNVGYILNIVPERFLFRIAVSFYIYIYMHTYAQVSRASFAFYFKPDKELAVNEMQIEIKQEKI